MNGYRVSIFSKEDGIVYMYDVIGANAMEAEDNAVSEHNELDRGEIDIQTPIKVELM